MSNNPGFRRTIRAMRKNDEKDALIKELTSTLRRLSSRYRLLCEQTGHETYLDIGSTYDKAQLLIAKAEGKEDE